MLILAWTTTAWGSPHGYYDFHFLVSPDGGATWIGKAGKIRSFPVPGDDDGPAFRVMAGGEYRPHPLSEQHWLNNVFAQNDMILFAYGDSLGHLYYRRFNWATKTSDVWSGPRSQICGATICEVTQGSFFSRADRPRGRILLTAGTSDHRIATLYSDDDGASWHDHALSRSRTAAFPWAVSGSPTPGPGGEVLGAVTDQSRNQVDFIRTAWR
jgi:hypothetical protein